MSIYILPFPKSILYLFLCFNLIVQKLDTHAKILKNTFDRSLKTIIAKHKIEHIGYYISLVQML